VWSDGKNYGISEGVFSPFPVTVNQSGKWSIVEGFELNEKLKEMVKVTNDELLAEKKTALGNCFLFFNYGLWIIGL